MVKVITPRIAPKRGRVDFKPGDFENLILKKGQRFQWLQSTTCACFSTLTPSDSVFARNQTSTAPLAVSRGRSDCPVCYGSGVEWHSSQEVRGLFLASQRTPQFQQLFARYGKGTAYITLNHHHLPNELDRFTALDQRTVFDEVLVRGSDVMSKPSQSIASRLTPLVGGDEVLDVIHVRKASLDGSGLSDGLLEKGVDFVVEDGAINWALGDALGTAPVEGQHFSIKYYAAPTFTVVSTPNANRDTWVKFRKPADEFRPLPVRVLVQMTQYVQRGGA